jgi:hypothetical protein
MRDRYLDFKIAILLLKLIATLVKPFLSVEVEFLDFELLFGFRNDSIGVLLQFPLEKVNVTVKEGLDSICNKYVTRTQEKSRVTLWDERTNRAT